MGEQVAASTKKEKRESFSERTAWSGPCNLNQQGSAVQITGFTSDQSKGESSCVLMADKTSVRNKKNRYANLVNRCSLGHGSSCHASGKMQMLRKAGFPAFDFPSCTHISVP